MLLEFILIFIVSLVFVKVLVATAFRLGLVDVPNGRSMHAYHTPRGAGIGFFLAVALVTPFFHMDLYSKHALTLLAIAMVFVVGVLDDHHDTSPKTKFLVIGLAAILVCMDGICVSSLGTLFNFEMRLGWFAMPFTVFAIVGFTNALNLVDGLDGLAGSISVIILSTLFMVGYYYSDHFMMTLSGAFISALLAFLVFNWNPAKIFMGDSGSLVLGFVIGLLVIQAATYIQPVSVLFIIALPIIDTIIVMIRRKRHGHSMFKADKTHIHHIVYKFFNQNVKKTVLFLAILQAVYSVTALLIVEHSDQSLTLILFGLNTLILYFILSEMLHRQGKQTVKKTIA